MGKRSLVLFIIIFTFSVNIFADTGTIKELLAQNGFSVPKKTVSSINFKLANLNGVEKELADYKGKIVFLNFWASWCGPCRSEMSSMETLYNEFREKGLVILAINLGENPAIVKKFKKDNNLSFPVLMDKDHSASALYGVRSIPTTYLIDRSGNILGMTVGSREWNSPVFRSLFREILK